MLRNVRKTTNPKIWAGVLEEIPLLVGALKTSISNSRVDINLSIEVGPFSSASSFTRFLLIWANKSSRTSAAAARGSNFSASTPNGKIYDSEHDFRAVFGP